MPKATAKEIYSACLVLLTGGIYLAAQADALFASGSTTIREDVIQLSKNEILSHTRTMVTIVLCFTGGILLLKHKKAGWLISVSILLLLLTVATGIFMSNVRTFNLAAVALFFVIVMLLMAVIFLLLRETRQRFNVVPANYMAVFMLFAVLIGFYFFLQ